MSFNRAKPDVARPVLSSRGKVKDHPNMVDHLRGDGIDTNIVTRIAPHGRFHSLVPRKFGTGTDEVVAKQKATNERAGTGRILNTANRPVDHVSFLLSQAKDMPTTAARPGALRSHSASAANSPLRRRASGTFRNSAAGNPLLFAAAGGTEDADFKWMGRKGGRANAAASGASSPLQRVNSVSDLRFPSASVTFGSGVWQTWDRDLASRKTGIRCRSADAVDRGGPTSRVLVPAAQPPSPPPPRTRSQSPTFVCSDPAAEPRPQGLRVAVTKFEPPKLEVHEWTKTPRHPVNKWRSSILGNTPKVPDGSCLWDYKLCMGAVSRPSSESRRLSTASGAEAAAAAAAREHLSVGRYARSASADAALRGRSQLSLFDQPEDPTPLRAKKRIEPPSAERRGVSAEVMPQGGRRRAASPEVRSPAVGAPVGGELPIDAHRHTVTDACKLGMARRNASTTGLLSWPSR